MKSNLLKKLVLSLTAASIMAGPVASQACTSFTLSGKDTGYVYARTLEFGLPLESNVITIPRNLHYTGVGSDGKPGTGIIWDTKYAAVGMNGLNQPILIDGMNEVGMTGGLLNAPNTAQYQHTEAKDSANSIASYQMLIYALTNFKTVEEAKAGFRSIQVNDSTLAVYKGVVPVRMTLHDAQGKSATFEYLKGQLVITDNPTGVMTNDPAFAWHLDNIGNYANLTPVERDGIKIGDKTFVPPSSGSGLAHIPGDMLSTSRFIRAVALTQAAPKNMTNVQQVNAAWHILGSFDISPGSVSLPATNSYGGGAGGYEVTEWSTVADTKNMVYYVKMYENVTPQAFDFSKTDKDAKSIQTYKPAHVQLSLIHI